MSKTLAEVADFLGAELKGDGSQVIESLATLSDAKSGDLSFLANMAYLDQLKSTQASAVIVHPKQADDCPCNALVLDNPYLGYAKVSSMFDTLPEPSLQVHPTAYVSPKASLGQNVSIGPNAVIEDGVVLESGVTIGAGTVVGHNCKVGEHTRLHGNVTLYHDIVIGQRCILHSGVVIGADGFGFANDQGKWHKIRQIGGVVIGNDVEIGANTTVDRGAMSDTLIADGVKLDNQIQIAHNVEIGENTAMAACAGISGSTKVGANCTVAGGAGLAGHLNIVDGSHITAMSLISKSITQPGSYSSGTAMQPSSDWKKSVARFRQLDDMAKRLKALEKAAKE